MHTPELTLAGPDSIVASIPFILGFTPRDSLIVMWLRDGCVRLTMRLDLPPVGAAPDEWADAVMMHRGESDEVILCVATKSSDAAHDDAGDLPSRELITILLERLAHTDCHVRDALLAEEDRWWSYLCDQPECCSPDGTPVDPEIVDDVAARFTLAGVGRLPDRESVLAISAADPLRQLSVHACLGEVRRQRAVRLAGAEQPNLEFEKWRDDSIDLVRDSLLGSAPTTSEQEAEILWALCDVRVRDTVLWEIARDNSHDAHRSYEIAAALLRAAPPGLIAPIGAVAALLAWLIGDGVRAVAALDRVHADDPNYALAELLNRSISAGLSPAGWREMMQGLSRKACRGRHRDDAPAA